MQVAIHNSQIELTWHDQPQPSRLHSLWLRNHCGCHSCAGERQSHRQQTVPTLERDPSTRPKTVSITQHGDLAVIWHNNHRSLYSRQWLLTHDYHRPLPASNPIDPWSEEFTLPAHRHSALINDPQAKLHCLNDLQRYGVALIKQAPLQPQHLIELSEHFGLASPAPHSPLSEHREGERSSEPSQAHSIKPHTPHNGEQTALNLLLTHCLDNPLQGGERLLVDSVQVLDQLRTAHPQHYQTLLDVPVPFQLSGKRPQTQTLEPLVQLNAQGQLRRCRFSRQTLLPSAAPADVMDRFYRAYLCLGRLIEQPRYQLSLKLDAGDILCLNTHRVLQGQRAYEPNGQTLRYQQLSMDWQESLALRQLLRANWPLSSWPRYAKG